MLTFALIFANLD